LFPVFGEDGAPQGAREAVDGRKGAEEEPREETEAGSGDEEGKIGLCEGEVEGNLGRLADSLTGDVVETCLLSQTVPDIIQVLGSQEVLRGPLLDPVLVVGVVVQRKDGFDILPLSLLGCDASAAFGRRVGNELVYYTQSLGLVEGLCFERFARNLFGGSRSDTVDPVADSVCGLATVLPRRSRGLHTWTCIPRRTGARRKRPSRRAGLSATRHCALPSAARRLRELHKASRTAQWPLSCPSLQSGS